MGSVYLHIPYCEKKCLYCDFYSIENRNSLDAFLSALNNEIDLRAAEFSVKEPIETIFFGGGTPSLLPPSNLEAILSRLHEHFSIEHNAEITVETNPGTVTAEKLRDYRSLGVNRLSIGIQSFHSEELRFLSRIHTVQEAESCVKSTEQAGFDNFNIDLIFALPGQTIDRWKETLYRGLELNPPHISAYSLIVEENTPLFAMVADRTVVPLSDEADAELYTVTMELLAERGYEHYEVSNYAKPGFACRHNKNYWNHANYVGFGPSAHSFWKSNALDGKRWWNVRSVASYCAELERRRLPVAGEEILGREKLYDEEIFLGLRSGGLQLSMVKKVYGIDVLVEHRELLEKYRHDSLIVVESDRLILTQRGYAFCDGIAEQLISGTHHRPPRV